MQSVVKWDLSWNFWVEIWDVTETSQCKSGFDNGFRVGGFTSEVKIAGSFKIFHVPVVDFEESGSEILFFAEFMNQL